MAGSCTVSIPFEREIPSKQGDLETVEVEIKKAFQFPSSGKYLPNVEGETE